MGSTGPPAPPPLLHPCQTQVPGPDGGGRRMTRINGDAGYHDELFSRIIETK